MPTIVGILTFVSRINFSLSGVEHENNFITLGPGLCFYFSVFNLSAGPEKAYIAGTLKEHRGTIMKLKLQDASYEYPFICEYSMFIQYNK